MADEPRSKGRIAAVALLVAIIGLLFGNNLMDRFWGDGSDSSTTTTSTSPSTDAVELGTEVLVYDPPVPEGSDPIPGACFVGSNATSRVDAFRCSFEDGLDPGLYDGIVDPCFSPGQDSSTPVDVVICPWADPSHPIVDDPVVLALDVPLPGTEDDQQPNTDRPPWLVELTNGAECSATTGMGAYIGQERINWVCDDGHLLIGEIDRSIERWRVFGKMEDDATARVLDIERAYF